MIDVARGEAGGLQAVTDRTLGELVRVIEARFLAVLDTVESLLFDGSHELAVNEQRCG